MVRLKNGIMKTNSNLVLSCYTGLSRFFFRKERDRYDRWILRLRLISQVINTQNPGMAICQKYRRIRIPIFTQHKYLNFKIGKILLEWHIQQISTNDKHLHEDFGIFNSLIQAFQKCPINLKLCLMFHDTVMQNVERIATL